MPDDPTLIDEDIVLRSDTDGVATLTLNRPAQRNALSRPLMAKLTQALDEINDDRSVHVVILAANGPGFCAGHDLREVRANPDQAFYKDLFRECSDLMMRVLTLRQPVIARVHGVATAAGCQLVATCDLAVASDQAAFATPGVNIGLFCSTPMVALSRNVSRKHAMEMLLTAEMISAERAYEIGLVNRVVAAGDLDEAVGAFAERIASKSPLTLAIGKEAFYRQLEHGISDAYAYASEVMVHNMMARDAEEGIDAFLQKRPAVWRGE